MARTQLARIYHYASDFDRALELLDQARPVLEEAGELHALTRTLAHYAGVYQHLGRPDESDRWAQQLIQFGESTGYQFAVGVGHEYQAENANICGLFERAAEEARLDGQVGERIGSLDRVAWSKFALAWAGDGLGNLEAAEQVAREGLELCDRIGEGRLAVWLDSILIVILANRGRMQEAEDLVEGLLARADAFQQVALQSVSRFAAAYLALRKAEPASALRQTEEAARVIGSTQSQNARLFIGGQMAEAYLRLGRLDEARRAGDEHLQLARRNGAFREQVRALRVLAGVALARDDAATALDLTGQAVALHDGRPDPIEEARTRVVRSAVYRQMGDVSAARQELLEAQAIFERTGAVPDLEQARKQLASLPRA
jgi:tetratricopeptide (TPR) repeat protein